MNLKMNPNLKPMLALVGLPKTWAALALGWMLAPVIQFVEQYVFDDWGFAASLMTVVAVDTLLGVWLQYRKGGISSAGFARLFQKVAVYGLFLVAVHAAATHAVRGQTNTLLGWLDAVAYASMLARELLSIVEKTARLGLYKPPAGLVRRLVQLQDDPASPVETLTPKPNPHATH
jgi:phage-related holin